MINLIPFSENFNNIFREYPTLQVIEFQENSCGLFLVDMSVTPWSGQWLWSYKLFLYAGALAFAGLCKQLRAYQLDTNISNGTTLYKPDSMFTGLRYEGHTFLNIKPVVTVTKDSHWQTTATHWRKEN